MMDKNTCDKQENTRRRKWVRLLPAIIMLIVMAAGAAVTAGTSQAYAADDPPDNSIWPDVTLKPDSTYDVGDAGWNTTVHIKKPGEYILKGQGRNVRILIESEDVDLWLKDKLNINCSATSNVGDRAAPIWVKDMGGTVRIISEIAGNIYLEGYRCPAIRKEGTNTKLVFETEDPAVPGTITAKGGADCPAIGCIPGLDMDPIGRSSDGTEAGDPGDPNTSGDPNDPADPPVNQKLPTIGNFVFNSGNIDATAGETAAFIELYGPAAIGGGPSANLNGLTINDGNIKAYSDGYGPAIGSGSGAVADNIEINGGTVYAEHVNSDPIDRPQAAAAIGSGGLDQYWHKSWTVGSLHINGGNVTAINTGNGAAIGAGQGSGVQDLQINGGTVIAQTKGWDSPGIGAGQGEHQDIECTIKITGGYIEAYGNQLAPGIGVTASRRDNTNTCNIEISGGTIKSYGGANLSQYSIGGPDPDRSNVVITGGSIDTCYPDNGKINGTVVDDKGQPLHKVEVTCQKIPQNGALYALIDPVFSKGSAYGMKDVYLVDYSEDTGKFYPWLPDTDDKLSQVTLETVFLAGSVQKDTYCGDFKFSDETGNLKPAQGMTFEELVGLLPETITPSCAPMVDAAVEAFTKLQQEEMAALSPELLQRLASADDVISAAKPAAKKTKLITVKNKSGKKALVKWKKTSGATGYKIKYSTSKKLNKSVKSKKVGAKTTKVTLNKLKKGKTYYVTVTPFTKVKNRITGKTRTIYGKTSSVKRVKIKK